MSASSESRRSWSSVAGYVDCPTITCHRRLAITRGVGEFLSSHRPAGAKLPAGCTFLPVPPREAMGSWEVAPAHVRSCDTMLTQWVQTECLYRLSRPHDRTRNVG